MDTIGFVGSGNMAEALIRGITAAGLYEPSNVLISDIRQERLEFLARTYKVVPATGNADLAWKARTIVLSVKPQKMAEALDSVKGSIGSEKLVISIAAGIKVSGIAAVLGNIPIIRVMPNTPALVGEGASALFANEAARGMLERALSIFRSAGKAVVVEEEGLIDAVTAISGSGPAYFFLLMEEMIAGAVELGLPEDTAKDLVLQTAKGAGLLAVEADKREESPAVLRRKVTSPGGTTEAALKVLSANGFGRLITEAVTAARDRSIELAG